MKEMTDIAKATVLLCTNLGLQSREFTPYTSIQWYELSLKIHSSCYKTPDKLIGEDEDNLAVNLGINNLEAQRIYGLLSRSYSLAFALEEIDQRGIGIVTKSDSQYPQRLKNVLGGRYAPPVLFYCGDLSLAEAKGVAIVGSRNVDEAGSDCAGKLAQTAAVNGLAVYSGGARGVDSISREHSLSAGGICVEFVADSMYKKIQSKEYRLPINDGRLLVLSAVRPDAGFNVANAMNRNKFVYALSQRAFVIASDKGKGGTWAGAKESLSKKYVQVSVWRNNNYAGNNELIKLGADSFESVADIDFQNLDSCKQSCNYEQGSLFNDNLEVSTVAEPESVYTKETPSTEPSANQEIASVEVQNVLDNAAILAVEDQSATEVVHTACNIYDYILPLLKAYFQTEKKFDDACVELEIEKSQLKKWLDKAEEQGVVRKLMRPKRYVVV